MQFSPIIINNNKSNYIKKKPNNNAKTGARTIIIKNGVDRGFF